MMARTVFGILMLLSLAAAANATHPGHVLSAYLSFLGDEVVDYPAVRLGVGLPEQSIKLRVVFTASVCPLCHAGAAIALFERAKTMKHRSSTFETIIPSILGRDMVNLAGVHTRLLIGFVDPHASDAVDGIEGYLYVMHGAPWTSATIDRHGLRLVFGRNDYYSENNGGSDFIPLETMAAGTITLVDNLSAHVNGNNASALARIAASKGFTTLGDYTILLAPDLDASFVPMALFQSYFGDKSFYPASASGGGGSGQSDPAQWKPFSIRLKGAGQRPGEERRLVIEGRSILPLVEGANAVDFTRLGHSAVAVSGSDNLKLLPHDLDNRTIILGGHTLWSSAFLHIEFNERGTRTVLLVPHRTASAFTTVEAVLFLVVGLAYVRWKMSRQLFDSYITDEHAIRYGFVALIESDSLLWPILLPLWLAPLVVLWRLRTLESQPATIISEGQFLHALFTGLAAWLGTLVLVAVFDVANMVSALRRSWEEFQTRVLPSPWQWFINTYFHDAAAVHKHADATLVAATTTTGSESPLLDPWRKLFEIELSSFLLRDVLVDTMLAIAAWAFFTPLESRVFSLPILLVILAVIVYNNLYHFFTLFFTLAWPVVAARKRTGRYMRRTRPRNRDLIFAFFMAVCTLNNVVLLVRMTLIPLMENFSSVYGAGDETISAVVALFILTTLFVAVLMADTSIQTQTLRGNVIPPNLVPLDTLRQSVALASSGQQQQDGVHQRALADF